MNKGLFIILLLSVAISQAAQDLIQSLQKGLFEEEANHNLAEAIKAYQSVITQAEEPRKIMATAIYRLGECYRKQGQTNLAALQYQRILSDFKDQTNLFALSRQQFAGFGVFDLAANAASPADLLQPDEAKELRRVQVLIKTSPDLAGQELANAAKAGYLEIIRWLLQQASMPPSGLNVALRESVEMGHRTIAEMLLKAGAQVNTRFHWTSDKYETPLNLAIKKGFYSVAQLLLEHKADPNAKEVRYLDFNGRRELGTPLITAVYHSAKMTELLLQHGADPNAVDAQGDTALACAVETRNPELVHLLLKYKAELNPINSNRSPLAMAVESGQTNLVQLLLVLGADSYLVKKNWGAFQALRNWGANWDTVATLGSLLLERPPGSKTPAITYELESTLLWAAQFNLQPIAQRLLELGVSANAQPKVTWETPLLIALGQRRSRADRWQVSSGMVELLLKNGADPNYQNGKPALWQLIDDAPWPYKGQGGWTVEVESILASCIKLLVEHGADANAVRPGQSSGSILNSITTYWPESEQKEHVLSYLREHGADPFVGRRNRVEVKGGANPVFMNYTNIWRQRTLLEAVYEAHGKGLHADYVKSDFTRIKINRLSNEKETTIIYDLTPVIEAGNWSQNLWLQSGDIIEIPKVELNLAVRWPRRDWEAALRNCLKRKISLVGKATNEVSFIEGRLPNVLFNSQQKLDQEDLKRVQVIRTDPQSGQKHQIIVDATTNPEIYLQDGDVVEVPAKIL